MAGVQRDVVFGREHAAEGDGDERLIIDEQHGYRPAPCGHLAQCDTVMVCHLFSCAKLVAWHTRGRILHRNTTVATTRRNPMSTMSRDGRRGCTQRGHLGALSMEAGTVDAQATVDRRASKGTLASGSPRTGRPPSQRFVRIRSEPAFRQVGIGSPDELAGYQVDRRARGWRPPQPTPDSAGAFVAHDPRSRERQSVEC